MALTPQSNTARVLYLSHGNPAPDAMIRGCRPPGFELVTLERDANAERFYRGEALLNQIEL